MTSKLTHTLKHSFLFGSLTLILTACQAPLTWDQQLSIYRAKCVDFGFDPGSVEFAECVQGQDKQALEIAEKERDRQNQATIAREKQFALQRHQNQLLRDMKKRR